MSKYLQYNEEVVKDLGPSPDKMNAIFHQLYLLLHSKECKQNVCPESNCELMKNILRHLEFCTGGEECPIRYCRSSKIMLWHWESRRCHRTCALCKQMRISLSATQGLNNLLAVTDSVSECLYPTHVSRLRPQRYWYSSHKKDINCLTHGFNSIVLDSVIELDSESNI